MTSQFKFHHSFLIITALIFSFSISSYAQSFYRLIGNSSSNNSLSGAMQLQQGGYLAWGVMYDPSFSQRVPAYCKLDDQGNVIWEKTAWYSGNFYVINQALELPSGELMFFSTFLNSSNNYAYIIFKTDSSGTILWIKTLSTIVYNARSLNSVTLSADNNILLGLTIGAYSYGRGEQTVFKLDTAANVIWNSAFNLQNGGDDYLRKMEEGPDHCIYLIGEQTATTGGISFPTFSKMDSSGNVLWSTRMELTFPGPKSGFRDMFIQPSGTILICGNTSYNGTIYPYSFILELDTSGAVLHEYGYRIPSESVIAYSISKDNQGRICLNGTVGGGVTTNPFILQTDSSGAILQSLRIDKNIYPGIINNNDATGFYAGTQVDSTIQKWALFKPDSNFSFCEQLSWSVTQDTPYLFGRTFKSYTTYSNPLTQASDTLISSSVNFTADGCLNAGITPVIANSRLIIFPSPATNRISIKLPMQVISIRIIDNLGRTVLFTGTTNEDLFEVDSSSFLAGLYHAECQLPDGSKLTGRFVIE
ncbi:MAG: hypothetical protein KA285_06440 [Bacteroidia bacterium]|nr:hypothetical protein [Bacteroidia bacterium]